MSHTEAVLLGVAVTVVLDLVVLRTRLLRRKAFWTAYAIVLFFQLVTNQWLTSRGVFDYGSDAIIGWRIGSAPVEDFLFGFALVTWSMCWWTWWGRRGLQAGPFPVRAVRPAAAARRSADDEDRTPPPAG